MKVELELDNLLKVEEALWKHCFRISWLKEGDQNTKFFHAKASSRRKRNFLHGLFNFQPFSVANGFVLDSVEVRLPTHLRDFLDVPFIGKEVRAALFQMSPSKAPGKDGFPTDFYQKFWDVVGGDVTKLCLECLNEGRSVEVINHSLLCLIPKVKNVERMGDLRPISLCNIIYKRISKASANRFCMVLDSVIAKTQSAFILGRLIMDNVMVGFECMHALRRKVNGTKKGFMSLKLDMSKAYDRVEWCFVEGMMRRLGFSDLWISKIMDCITSVTYSFILNGKVSGNIKPSKGLRQDDPLSSYFFLICVEGLSSLIVLSEKHGDYSGFSCSKMGPKITHLFFADDSLLFTKASVNECTNIKQILRIYSEASGQSVNFQKSAVRFSKQISVTDSESGRNYKVGVVVFFSVGGREVLIKAMVQSIPMYTMNLFRLPVSLISKLHSLCARFWWGGSDSNRKLHWCTWENLCKPRCEGGLGFHDLGLFTFGSRCFGTVDSLMFSHGVWNENLMRQSFFKEEAEAILSIPLSGFILNDSLLWHYEISGNYSVKSGYKLAMSLISNPSCSGLSPRIS
ncbi:hypothetical protein LWI29_030060 [Acer saccharum]|uniref:Reverse transcriptase domain-containing protein n=1 Tax=Acer saccharum TaxID=4024 RepID=A0AA39VPI2_ACESA|nr:hypothetical protein LWI29_030060 [Acer saccharum]